MPIVEIKPGMVVEFPDNLSPDELNAAVAQAAGSPPPEPSRLSKGVSAVGQIMADDKSPLNMINKGVEKARGIAGDVGEAVAVNAAASGVDPHLAALGGTMGAMVPDAMLSVDPFGATRPSAQAAGFASRAGGLGKVFNKTKFGRAKTALAGRTALEEGLVPASGNAEEMARRVNMRQTEVGQELGRIRDQAGKQFAQPVFSALDKVQTKLLGGAQGKQGLYKQVSQKVQELKDTLIDLMPDYQPAKEAVTKDTGILDASGKAITRTIAATPEKKPPIGLNTIVNAKNRLANTINWFADNASQKDAKALAMALEEGVTGMLAQSGGDIRRYKMLKSLYGSLKTLNQGLDNELSGLAGNSPIKARALLTGTMVPGSAVGQAAAAGLTELGIRRGAGVAARALYSLEKGAPKNMNLAAIEAYDRIMERRKKKKN